MARLPTFFQDAKATYALFPGAPPRGLADESVGAWVMSMDNVPITMRWAVFQHACIVLCSHADPQVWVGVYEKDTIRFGGPTRLQARMRTLLTSFTLAPIRWNWRWIPGEVSIPDTATWFAPNVSHA